MPKLEASGIAIDGQTAVDRRPGNPAVGFGSVWVPSSASGILDRVDPSSMKVTARIRSSLATTSSDNQYFDSVAVSKNAVWHASDAGGVIVRIDPKRNRVVARIHVPGRPGAIATGPAGVYVSLFNDSRILRIDPATGKIVRRAGIGGPAMGVAYGAGSVWAVTNAGPAVVRLNPVTLAVQKRISIKSSAPFLGGYFSAWWIAADAATVCAGNQQQNAVSTVDPGSGTLTRQTVLGFGGVPFSVAADAGACWGVNNGGVFVVPAAGSPTAYSHLPPLGASSFVGIATGAGAAWVTAAGRNALLRVR